MTIFNVISLLGGIALFLYGMSIMGSGLEKLASGKMQTILQKLTASTLRGVLLGTLITALIQSSAGTIVTVSYTHLDVYKRQACRWGSRSGW